MKYFASKIPFLLRSALVFLGIAALLPSSAFAATLTSQQATQQKLIQEIAQLQAELNAAIGSSTAATVIVLPTNTTFINVPLSYSQDLPGHVRITLAGFERLTDTTGIASTSPLYGTLGKFLLNYNTCSTGTYCTTTAYPTMTSIMGIGQSTGYMGETIILNSFGPTSANISVTPTK
jgi:hypothetical protein